MGVPYDSEGHLTCFMQTLLNAVNFYRHSCKGPCFRREEQHNDLERMVIGNYCRNFHDRRLVDSAVLRLGGVLLPGTALAAFPEKFDDVFKIEQGYVATGYCHGVVSNGPGGDVPTFNNYLDVSLVRVLACMSALCSHQKQAIHMGKDLTDHAVFLGSVDDDRVMKLFLDTLLNYPDASIKRFTIVTKHPSEGAPEQLQFKKKPTQILLSDAGMLYVSPSFEDVELDFELLKKM